MATINSADYGAIKDVARIIREKGMELNSDLATAYVSVKDMHASWYGKRYNALLTEFITIKPQVEALLKLVVTEIPFALETIAKNYSVADTGSSIVTPQEASIALLADLEIKEDTGMRFISSEVAEVQQNVTNNFNNAIERMDEIEKLLKNVDWSSDASEAFEVKFATIKTNVVGSLENVETAFSKLMTQAETDISGAETGNTVS